LALGLLPTLVGGLLLLSLLTVRGGAPNVLRALAACPFACGVWSLVAWSRTEGE